MFNALRYTEALEAVDFTRQQAEKIVNVLVEVMEQNLATKIDLKEEGFLYRGELKADIQELRTELKADIQELRTEFRADIQELRNQIQAIHQELAHHSTRFDRLESKITQSEFRMTIKLGSLMVIGISVLGFLIKFT